MRRKDNTGGSVPQVAAEIQEVMDEGMEDWKTGRMEDGKIGGNATKEPKSWVSEADGVERCDQILRSDL